MKQLHFATLFVFLWSMTSSTCTGKREVMLPVKAGEDVGVVIVAGAYLYFDQYQALGTIARKFTEIILKF